MVDRLNDQRVMPEYIYNYTCNFAFRAELDAGNYESREYERPIGNPSFFRENHASKIVSRLPICNAYLYGSSFNYGPPGLIDIQNAFLLWFCIGVHQWTCHAIKLLSLFIQ